MVEKPKNPPSNLAVVGIYLIQDAGLLYGCLDEVVEQNVLTAGEIQLTDAMLKLEQQQPFYGYHYRGNTFDCGSPEGFVKANIAFALAHPDMRKGVLSMLERLIASLEPEANMQAAE